MVLSRFELNDENKKSANFKVTERAVDSNELDNQNVLSNDWWNRVVYKLIGRLDFDSVATNIARPQHSSDSLCRISASVPSFHIESKRICMRRSLRLSHQIFVFGFFRYSIDWSCWAAVSTTLFGIFGEMFSLKSLKPFNGRYRSGLFKIKLV